MCTNMGRALRRLRGGYNLFVCAVRYRDLEETSTLAEWFWTVVENFTPQEKVLFLRFISGRSRLPANIEDLSQRFQVSRVI